MIHALALVAVLASVSPNRTADTRSVKNVSLAVQVAREFLTPQLWNRTVNSLVAQYAAQLRAMAARNGGTVDDGLEAALRQIYDEYLPYSAVIDLQAKLLERHFAKAELVQMRRLYRSPLGIKMRDRMPEIQQDAVQMTLQKLNAARISEVLRSHLHLPSNPAAGKDAAPRTLQRDAGAETGLDR